MKLVTVLLFVMLYAGSALAHGKIITVNALVTGYCKCEKCCGASASGITSTGEVADEKMGCAVDPRLIPYNSKVCIPKIGWRRANDTGGAMRADGAHGIYHVDVYFKTHDEALRFGHRKVRIKIRMNK